MDVIPDDISIMYHGNNTLFIAIRSMSNFAVLFCILSAQSKIQLISLGVVISRGTLVIEPGFLILAHFLFCKFRKLYLNILVSQFEVPFYDADFLPWD